MSRLAGASVIRQTRGCRFWQYIMVTADDEATIYNTTAARTQRSLQSQTQQ